MTAQGIIDRLAQHGPWVHSSSRHGGCIFCGQGEGKLASADPDKHGDGCFWRLSVEAKKAAHEERVEM